MTDALLQHDLDHVRILTLNRPAARNALSGTLLIALVDAFTEAHNDANVHAIVLAATGEEAFCAGLDLKELRRGSLVPEALHGRQFDIACAMRRCSKPIVGAVQGAAVAGGFELALGCDILLAGPQARFCDAHLQVGLLPGWGLSHKLAQRIGAGRAKELSLTARYLDAQTAESWGLVDRLVIDDVRKEAERVATLIAGWNSLAVQTYCDLIEKGAGSSEQTLAREEQAARRWNRNFRLAV